MSIVQKQEADPVWHLLLSEEPDNIKYNNHRHALQAPHALCILPLTAMLTVIVCEFTVSCQCGI